MPVINQPGGAAGPANVSPSTVIQTGNGSPAATVTPTQTGSLYQDLTNGALYQAVGATNADWVLAGGASPTMAQVPGIGVQNKSLALVLGNANGGATLTDKTAWNDGTGNGVWWNSTNAGTGAQQLDVFLGTTGQYDHTWAADGSYTLPRGIKSGQQTSGALPTLTIASGTGRQIDTFSDRETHTPVTFNPGVATTATCTVALSPDNSTYSTMAVITKPVGTVFDGEIEDVVVRVPAGWYIRLTVNAQAAIGTTTYY